MSYNPPRRPQACAESDAGATFYKRAQPPIPANSIAAQRQLHAGILVTMMRTCQVRLGLSLFSLLRGCLRDQRLKAIAINRMISMLRSHWENGNLTEARRINAMALDLDPHNRDLFNSLYTLSQELNETSQYLHDLHVTWHESNPQDADGYACLIESYLGLNNTTKATELLNELRALDSGSAVLTLLAGQIHHHENRLEEAVECFTSVLEEAPRNVRAFTSLALLMEVLNRREETIELLRKAIEIAPDNPTLYNHLARLKYYKTEAHADIQHIQKVIARRFYPRPARASLHFTLGIVYDYLGDYAEAFTHFRRGNDLKKREIGNDFMRSFVDLMLDVCQDDFVGVHADLDADYGNGLVFIVGMPRSGSTLTEQILASHPAVFAAGERTDLMDLVVSLEKELGEYPRCLKELDRGLIKRLSRAYLDSVGQRIGDKQVYVDKALANYMHLGLIAAMFPGAKFIHCIRDPIDTCLSCYFQDFTHDIYYANDLAMLGSSYRDYERLMKHWKTIVGRPEILDVQYEEVVRQPEAAARRILSYCELPWNAACLEYYNTPRAVFTASNHQVRLPIYQSSVERWRNYEEFIPELLRALA
jgi:tetratricopeptide (TPR) repeat protein